MIKCAQGMSQSSGVRPCDHHHVVGRLEDRLLTGCAREDPPAVHQHVDLSAKDPGTNGAQFPVQTACGVGAHWADQHVKSARKCLRVKPDIRF